MDTNTTAASVIPFSFQAREVRAVVIDDQPWFVAADVCKILGQSNTTKALYALDDDERSNFKLGRQGSVNIINESGLYTLILRCDDAIKKGSDAHAFRKWITAEVLPAIRKHGRYSDESGKMATLVHDVIGVSGANLIGGVISQKVSILPVGVQRQARHRMHSVLHTRFNVPRTELIPSDKLDAACEYVAAYVLEGEWIGSSKAAMELSEREVQALYIMMSHYHFASEYAEKSGIYAIARMTESRPLANFHEHFSDIGIGFRCLDERRAEIYSIYSRRGADGGYALKAAS